jgi:hypothetical protein
MARRGVFAAAEGVIGRGVTMNEVEPRLYTTVIREMIRHENDVTNHRIMWLLIVQGLIANAYVSGLREPAGSRLAIETVGFLVTLSAFVILYKSYHARGYLEFLGNAAKEGRLRPEHLPLAGWLRPRIRGWRRRVWACPWLACPGDLLEPYFFIPALLVFIWLHALLRDRTALGTAPRLVVTAGLVAVALIVFCVAWVRTQEKDETETLDEPNR